METHFTFPDGGLRYDCAACGQRCCRGKGIAFSAPELAEIGRRAPAVLPFVRLRSYGAGGTADATNFTDGCWFLQKDGLCALETGHGRDAKPGTCRLFPFNRVYRVGDVMVVDVNTLLCPVQPAGGGAGVRHAEILAEIEALAGSPLVGGPAPEPPGLAPDWLAVERGVAEAAAAGAPAVFGQGQGEGDAAAWSRVYGIEAPEREALEAQVAPRIGLILPSLRFRRLFSSRRAPYAEEAARLPRRAGPALPGGAGLAEHGAGALAAHAERDLGGAGRGPGCAHELGAAGAARVAAVRGGRAPRAGAGAGLGALLSGAFRGGQTLGALVEAAAAVLPAPHRPLSVALAAGQLATLGVAT